MPQESKPQRKTVQRVMHEYKHNELKSGPSGRAGKVKSRRQAVAIALKEAGASRYESKSENEHNLRRTQRKERRGETALAETEGRKTLPDRRKNSASSRARTAAQKPRRKATASRKSTAAKGKTAASRKTVAARKSATRKSAARTTPARGTRSKKSTRSSTKRASRR